MTKLALASLGAALLAAVVWVQVQPSPQEGADTDGRYPIARTVQYSFELRNTTNRLIEHADFWTYGPVSQTSFQRCRRITASHPYRLDQDEHGNQVLHFELRDLAPYETRVLRIRAELDLAETPQTVPWSKPEAFLGAAPLIELGEPELQRIAAKVTRPDKREAARKAFDWVVRNIRYEGYVEEARGALYATRSRRGDCTEFAYLYSALCRLNGIPARAIGGYLSASDGVLSPADYHNWVEIYVDGAWRIVDPQNRLFIQRETDYIPMSILTKADERGPLAGAHRFAYTGGRIQIKMQ